jgi:epoxyqueuosine reductase
MSKRRQMKDNYRRFSFLSDIEGIKNAIGEMRGMFFSPQPVLNRDAHLSDTNLLLDEGWFIRTIKDKIAGHPDNQMEYPYFGEPIFEAPLVGFVSGDDPILKRYKTIIGPHHFTPWEIMRWQAEKNGVQPPEPEDISVVSFVMPFTQNTRRDNAAALAWTSERWAQSRLSGEIFSQIFVREIVTDLMGQGILAIAPDVTPMFDKKRYPKVGWASPWSHRHMAYAAGLGSFGMHDFPDHGKRGGASARKLCGQSEAEAQPSAAGGYSCQLSAVSGLVLLEMRGPLSGGCHNRRACS